MAFISLIFTALSLRKLQRTLVDEKLDAIKADEDETFKKKFRFRHIPVDIKVAFKRFFRKICRCPEKSSAHRTCYNLRHEGSCENYVMKSIFGFIGGVLLTYLLYIFFIFQLNIKLTTATVVCSFLGCILTVGLSFSSNVRCVVLLTLPQFFSKRGRQALLAYAFALALTGPAQNTLNNMGILSESLACGQEQLKQAVKQIIDVIKKPFVAIKEAIKKVIKTVKEVVKKIKEILLKIKRIIMALVRVIKSVFEFLGKIINICNKELGTPFQRCTRVFENAIADCNAKMGPLFNWLCSLTYIVKAVCYIVKVFDYVCMLVDFISDSVVGVVIRKVKIFVRHIKTMFYVRIKFSHSFKFETTASKSMTEIAKAIVAEIKDRSRGIVAFFNFMTSAVMLFFLYLVFQYFREIDQRRAKLEKETVLPLNKKEEKIYVPISSGKLAQTERRKLSKAAVALATASVKLGTHMIADYCLYWILTLITYHGRYQSKIQAPNMPVAHISGEGFIAILLRSIVNAFQPVGIKLEIDTIPCLPIPIPPDFDRYVQIGITLLFCWILTILEPYGLRFRNYIMGYYHPVRAKQRTIWLYNHILRSRSSFLLFARRQLRRKFGGKGVEEVSCKDHLRARLNCAIFRICLGSDRQAACLLCGEVFREIRNKRFVKCHTPGCPGLFCLECYADLNNICPICLSPIEYGDLDDEDEEKDSSGDEQPKKPEKKRKCPWFSCGKFDDDDKEQLISDEEEEEEHEEKEERIEKEKKGKSDECKCEESDSSTDYSCTYQYDEGEQQPYPRSICFKDVEKQDIPDYASMESFRDEKEPICIDVDNKIIVPKGHAALVRMDVSATVSHENVGEDPQGSVLYKDDDEEVPLLEDSPESIFPNLSDRHVEFIGVPRDHRDRHKSVKRKINIIPSDSMCCCSDLDLIEHLEDASLITIPRSTMSTSTRSDCKYCREAEEEVCSSLDIGTETEEELRNIVPKLDLSFLHKDDKICYCDNPILSQRFRNVTYETICETPPSPLSNRTLESSSLLSSLENSPPTEQTPTLRKRNVRTQYPLNLLHPIHHKGEQHEQRNAGTQCRAPQDIDSPSSMDSYEFNRAQNRRVRQYYEVANKKSFNDDKCQCHDKRRSIGNVFRKWLPKRKTRQNCLPLHRLDIHDDVEVQSYNYRRENWDTLSLDTDSPAYPFGAQISSDTSEDNPLGGRRIRGGECTHLINCKLIGRSCPQKRVRSFDAKSEFSLGCTLLKDFSRLSLPPRPKPANTKDFLDRYFQTIKPSSPDFFNLGTQMKSLEANKVVPLKKNSDSAVKTQKSDYIVTESAISTVSIKDDNTPPSSDSGLSEDTCVALFGGPCPRGLGKQSSPSSFFALQDTNEEQEAVPGSTHEEAEKVDSGSVKEQGEEDEGEEEKELGSIIILDTSPPTIHKEDSLEKRKSIQQIKGVHRCECINPILKSKNLHPDRRESEDNNTEANKSKEQIRQSSQTPVHSVYSNQIEEQHSTSLITGQSARRKSTQLNQLLYKDDKTEISLVQKISPEKEVTETQSSSKVSTKLSPSVKLQISLHNSIIKEDAELPKAEQDAIEMKSPKSSDKIVETQDTFPLRREWTSSEGSRDGKLITASDKTQQTSDNNIYRSSYNSLVTANERKTSTDARPSSSVTTHSRYKISSPSDTRYSPSNPRYTSSDPYYSNEEPEKDPNCIHNNCRCSKCKEKRNQRLSVSSNLSSARGDCSYNCCQCPILEETIYPRTLYRPPSPPPFERSVPARPRGRQYQINALLPTTSESDVLPPPPPPPPRPAHFPRASRRHSGPRQRAKVYNEPCYENCTCCVKKRHLKSFDYSRSFEQPSISNRYAEPRMRSSYEYEYDDVPDDDQYNFRKSSLSELPYQNNEEYLELVEELQDTLHTRNRNRVKRAMQEFEDRSKHNRPLERPIINYDETSESEEPIIRKIDQLRTDRKKCCAEDKCSCVKRRPPGYSESGPRQESSRRERFGAGERPSHWTMNPDSGEWSKACKCSKQRGPKGGKGRGEPYQCLCNCERSRYQ